MNANSCSLVPAQSVRISAYHSLSSVASDSGVFTAHSVRVSACSSLSIRIITHCSAPSVRVSACHHPPLSHPIIITIIQDNHCSVSPGFGLVITLSSYHHHYHLGSSLLSESGFRPAHHSLILPSSLSFRVITA